MSINISGSGIVEANLADDAVTLAKMAGGTDGNLITYDASGDPAYVTTGTSGQVLTSGGAGVAPTFQTAAGGGKVLQVIYARTNTTVTKTLSGNAGSGDYVDTGLTATITPTESDSDILVMFTQNVYTERTGSQYAYANDYDLSLYRDATSLINTGTFNGYGNFDIQVAGATDNPVVTSILAHNYFDTTRSSGTSAITYKTQGTPYRPGLAKFNYKGYSTMILMEIGV